MQVDLSGKVVLLAGSSVGIGRAIALKLAQNGALLVINGRNPEVGLGVVDEVKKAGGDAIFARADITDYQEVSQMVAEVIRQSRQSLKWLLIRILILTHRVIPLGLRPDCCPVRDEGWCGRAPIR